MNRNNIAQQIYTKICFNPTINQKIIVEDLSNWLINGSFDSIFILNGYAGTGKTTIIAAFVAALKDLKISTVLLAPTGRAANVLTRYSKTQANTIHKRIYRETTNAQYESRYSLGYNECRDTIFIVDEASMLSSSPARGAGSQSLLDDLVKFVASGVHCRLMLVGDDAQLPPVGADYSPALDRNFMGRYGEVHYSTMTEVVRQEAGSGILHNATLLREMMSRGTFEIPKFNLDFPDFELLEMGEFSEKMQDCYDHYGRNETIIITRSNKRALRYNMGVRRYTLYSDEEIERGEMLMVVKNNYYYTQLLKDCPMGFVANGDVARIERIRRYEDFYNFHYALVDLSFGDYSEFELSCWVLLDTLYTESPNLGEQRSQELLIAVEQDYLDIGSRIERYRQIRRNPHFNALQIKYSYAVTCHKAQGGQWKAVFVDRCIFGDEEMSHDLMRWLYTALSRATEKVYLVGFDERFF